jgi:hypothetical protein
MGAGFWVIATLFVAGMGVSVPMATIDYNKITIEKPENVEIYQAKDRTIITDSVYGTKAYIEPSYRNATTDNVVVKIQHYQTNYVIKD